MKSVRLDVSRSLLAGLRNTALAGVLLFVAGLYFAPERAWAAFLVAFVLFSGVALCGPFFLALLTLSRARWPGELKRIPEALSAALPLAALLGVVLLSGVHALYPWSHAADVEADPLLTHKAPYLNLLGFAARLVVSFALWTWLARRLVAAREHEEAHPGVAAARRSIRAAALFVAVFALTFSLSSVDWIESLDAHWSSTIFTLVVLSTVALAGHSVCILLATGFGRRAAAPTPAQAERVEDLGRIMLGLSLFWVYIGYCQHMLIWYTNMPEETSWYVARTQGEWGTVARVCVTLCWLVPFLALLPRKLRRSPTAVARVAAAVLSGSVLSLYYLTAPAVHGATVGLGVLEIALPCAALAGLLWVALRSLAPASARAGDG